MITFIIVTWNNSDIIKECLDTLYKYVKLPFKVIVVDNASSDNTVDVIKKGKYHNCKVIELNENVGFAKGNNIALQEVDTEYLCYLNPDVIFIEDCVSELVEYITKNEKCGIIGCKLLNKDLSYQSSAFKFELGRKIIASQFKINLYNFKKKKIKRVDWIIGAFMIMRTDESKKVCGFAEDYFMYVEDMDLCTKMKKFFDKDVIYYGARSIIHLGGQSEKKNINYNKDEKVLKNILKYQLKFSDDYIKDFNILKRCYKIKYIFSKLFFCKKSKKMKYLYQILEGYDIQ